MTQQVTVDYFKIRSWHRKWQWTTVRYGNDTASESGLLEVMVLTQQVTVDYCKLWYWHSKWNWTTV